MPQPTHVNAYKAELAEAENALAQAKGRVNQLKETIATMEQSQNASSDVAAQDASLPPTSGSDAPENETVPSEPITETPNEASDMPPASSEVPTEVTTDKKKKSKQNKK
jgi:hypothetical protein